MRLAAQRFFPDASDFEFVGGRPHLLRLRSAGHTWRVREWPAGSAPQRVAFTAELRKTLRADLPDLVAEPARTPDSARPIVEIGGRFYDADRWQSGDLTLRRDPALLADGRAIMLPLTAALLPPELIALAIARWHNAAEPLRGLPSPPAAPLRAVFAAIGLRWRTDRDRLRHVTSGQPWAQRWLRFGEQVMDRAETLLGSVEYLEAAPVVVAHLAIWPNHVLVRARDPSALLDPSHAAVSTPLLDIAAVITRFNRWSSETAELALGAYAEERRLTPDERRMLPVVAAIDLVAESGRLLSLSFNDAVRQTPAVERQSRDAAETLVASLEAVSPAVSRAGEAVRTPKRVWRHRTHPTAHRPSGQRDDRGGAPSARRPDRPKPS